MQLKFKAYYKPLKVMLQPEQIESINLETKVLGVYMKMDGKGYHKLRMSDFELLPYTGLKDKHGKEIYEGDICRDSLGWVFAVEWDEDGRFIGKHSKPRGDAYICYVGREPAVEVIGNRWDNPELLEG